MFARQIFSPQHAQSKDGKTPTRLTTRDVVPARETTLTGVKGTLVNRNGDFDLAGRDAWLFISIKNRQFNRHYIKWFIRMCGETGLRGRICRVDDPYLFNRMAELDCADLPVEEANKITRLSEDIGRMVQKALNGSRTKNVEMVTWRDIAEETPAIYHEELRAAFNAPGLVRDALKAHIQSVKPIDTDKQLRQFAEFFLCEVPILFHAYYSNGTAMDIYPGAQPEFFWQIEMGLFETELPALTALTKQCRSMLYFDTITKPES